MLKGNVVRKWQLVLVVLVVVFAVIFGSRTYMDHRAAAAAAAQGFPAVSVATAVARRASWNTRVNAVGTLRGVSGTEITAQIAGNVTRIGFESGARVKKGDLLVQLDNSNQLATLHADQAQLKLAEANLVRARRLVSVHAISEESLQTSQKSRDVAEAAVESDEATLHKLHITAPFSGVLGIRKVSLGQYVSPSTAIVSLQQWKPLLLDFSLPQDALAQIQAGQKIVFTTDARPGQSFVGKITAVGSQIDPETRNINVQATLDNQRMLLRPGLFGHVMLDLGKTIAGISVPQTAVAYSTFGNTVYVVATGEHGGSAVHAKIVRVLDRRDGQVLLAASGLKDNVTVVTAGQNKLRDGASVHVNNDVQP